MSPLINPNSLRIPYIRNWKTLFPVSNINSSQYSNNFHKYLIVKSFIVSFFNRRFFKKHDIIFSHFIYKASLNKQFIEIFIFSNFIYSTLVFFRKESRNYYSRFFRRKLKLLNSNINNISKLLLFQISNTLKLDIAKIFPLYFNNLYVKIRLINFNLPTASLFSNFVVQRLRTGFTLMEIIKPVLRFIKRNRVIDGLQFITSGRFTRKQRASHAIHKVGPVPRNNFSRQLDYSFSTIHLKYGSCSIKVALSYKQRDKSKAYELSRKERLFFNFSSFAKSLFSKNRFNLQKNNTYIPMLFKLLKIRNKVRIKKAMDYRKKRRLLLAARKRLQAKNRIMRNIVNIKKNEKK